MHRRVNDGDVVTLDALPVDPHAAHGSNTSTETAPSDGERTTQDRVQERTPWTITPLLEDPHTRPVLGWPGVRDDRP